MVKCQSCEGEFSSQNIGLKTSKLLDGMHVIYFDCPLCYAHYSIMTTNKEIRDLQVKQNYLLNKIKKRGRVITQKELEHFVARQTIIKNKIDELNGRVISIGK